jgi:hypothetical protein
MVGAMAVEYVNGDDHGADAPLIATMDAADPGEPAILAIVRTLLLKAKAGDARAANLAVRGLLAAAESGLVDQVVDQALWRSLKS